MNIYLYIFILAAGIFFTPFVFYFLGHKRKKKQKPVWYPTEVDKMLEKNYLEQLQYP